MTTIVRMTQRQRAWASYARVSRVGERDRDSASFHTVSQQQRAVERAVAPDRIALERVDLDRSGTTTDGRDGLAESVAWVMEDPQRRGLAVYDYSRLARNLLDTVRLIDDLHAAGAGFASAMERVDTRTEFGRFQMQVQAAIAEMQARRIGGRWKSVLDDRLARGLTKHGRRRFGYRIPLDEAGAPDRNRPQEPDEAEAPVLVEMYTRYLRGEGVRAIAAWLNTAGVPAMKSREGGWTTTSVQRILDSGFAAGIIRTRDGDTDGAHEPVVPRDVFERYERERARRAEMHPRQRAPRHYLSGLVHCGLCGDYAYVNTTDPGNPRASFRCKTYAVKGKDACRGVFIKSSTVEGRLGLWLAGQSHALLAAAAEARVEEVEAEGRVSVQRREADRLEGVLARLARAWADGAVDDAAYDLARSGAERELAAARRALDDAYRGLDRAVPLAEDDFAVLEAHPADPAVWRATLAKVVDSIWVHPSYWEIRPRRGEATRYPR